ncbi:DNA-deoxyinosine glycosylase [Marinomonas balearica]|uniref:G/U mismatch-specific uracil-DNA glycosylase n=1 Tax=Marinomonas balearica TaxID=491947 RepID=A0A4R6MIP6_9GAMM|nr:DNA-deoxyinosine glycosylase [Marinomonas balearica]TDP01882.1 G/U mismatch-specific uracil-DNA glycosylase [Marinomonas balearica]
MTVKHSFKPVVPAGAMILVLGSMPGEASLDKQAYYAHPQNLFWKIPASLPNAPSLESYLERIESLDLYRVALWDVLQQCQREGSLDSKIIKSSEKPNDIVTLLKQTPSLKKICFNGQKAFQSFKKHILKAEADFFKQYELVTLPSTSPANASIPKEIKYETWIREVWT